MILLDLAMPNRTGLECLPELRRVAPERKIIVFSGFSMASVAEEALGLGAVLYLTKGATPTRSTTRSNRPLRSRCRGTSASVLTRESHDGEGKMGAAGIEPATPRV